MADNNAQLPAVAPRDVAERVARYAAGLVANLPRNGDGSLILNNTNSNSSAISDSTGGRKTHSVAGSVNSVNSAAASCGLGTLAPIRSAAAAGASASERQLREALRLLGPSQLTPAAEGGGRWEARRPFLGATDHSSPTGVASPIRPSTAPAAGAPAATGGAATAYKYNAFTPTSSGGGLSAVRGGSAASGALSLSAVGAGGRISTSHANLTSSAAPPFHTSVGLASLLRQSSAAAAAVAPRPHTATATADSGSSQRRRPHSAAYAALFGDEERTNNTNSISTNNIHNTTAAAAVGGTPPPSSSGFNPNVGTPSAAANGFAAAHSSAVAYHSGAVRALRQRTIGALTAGDVAYAAGHAPIEATEDEGTIDGELNSQEQQGGGGGGGAGDSPSYLSGVGGQHHGSLRTHHTVASPANAQWSLRKPPPSTTTAIAETATSGRGGSAVRPNIAAFSRSLEAGGGLGVGTAWKRSGGGGVGGTYGGGLPPPSPSEWAEVALAALEAQLGGGGSSSSAAGDNDEGFSFSNAKAPGVSTTEAVRRQIEEELSRRLGFILTPSFEGDNAHSPERLVIGGEDGEEGASYETPPVDATRNTSANATNDGYSTALYISGANEKYTRLTSAANSTGAAASSVHFSTGGNEGGAADADAPPGDPTVRMQLFRHALLRRIGVADELARSVVTADKDHSNNDITNTTCTADAVGAADTSPVGSDASLSSPSPSSAPQQPLKHMQRFVLMLMREYESYIQYLERSSSLSAAAVAASALHDTVVALKQTSLRAEAAEAACEAGATECERRAEEGAALRAEAAALRGYVDELRVAVAATQNGIEFADGFDDEDGSVDGVGGEEEGGATPNTSAINASSSGVAAAGAGRSHRHRPPLLPNEASPAPYVEAVRRLSAEVAALRSDNIRLASEGSALAAALSARSRELAHAQESLASAQLQNGQLRATMKAVHGYASGLEAALRRLAGARAAAVAAELRAAAGHAATMLARAAGGGSAAAAYWLLGGSGGGGTSSSTSSSSSSPSSAQLSLCPPASHCLLATAFPSADSAPMLALAQRANTPLTPAQQQANPNAAPPPARYGPAAIAAADAVLLLGPYRAGSDSGSSVVGVSTSAAASSATAIPPAIASALAFPLMDAAAAASPPVAASSPHFGAGGGGGGPAAVIGLAAPPLPSIQHTRDALRALLLDPALAAGAGVGAGGSGASSASGVGGKRVLSSVAGILSYARTEAVAAFVSGGVVPSSPRRGGGGGGAGGGALQSSPTAFFSALIGDEAPPVVASSATSSSASAAVLALVPQTGCEYELRRAAELRRQQRSLAMLADRMKGQLSGIGMAGGGGSGAIGTLLRASEEYKFSHFEAFFFSQLCRGAAPASAFAVISARMASLERIVAAYVAMARMSVPPPAAVGGSSAASAAAAANAPLPSMRSFFAAVVQSGGTSSATAGPPLTPDAATVAAAAIVAALNAAANGGGGLPPTANGGNRRVSSAAAGRRASSASPARRPSSAGSATPPRPASSSAAGAGRVGAGGKKGGRPDRIPRRDFLAAFAASLPHCLTADDIDSLAGLTAMAQQQSLVGAAPGPETSLLRSCLVNDDVCYAIFFERVANPAPAQQQQQPLALIFDAMCRLALKAGQAYTAALGAVLAAMAGRRARAAIARQVGRMDAQGLTGTAPAPTSPTSADTSAVYGGFGGGLYGNTNSGDDGSSMGMSPSNVYGDGPYAAGSDDPTASAALMDPTTTDTRVAPFASVALDDVVAAVWAAVRRPPLPAAVRAGGPLPSVFSPAPPPATSSSPSDASAASASAPNATTALSPHSNANPDSAQRKLLATTVAWLVGGIPLCPLPIADPTFGSPTQNSPHSPSSAAGTSFVAAAAEAVDDDDEGGGLLSSNPHLAATLSAHPSAAFVTAADIAESIQRIVAVTEYEGHEGGGGVGGVTRLGASSEVAASLAAANSPAVATATRMMAAAAAYSAGGGSVGAGAFALARILEASGAAGGLAAGGPLISIRRVLENLTHNVFLLPPLPEILQ